MLVNRLLSVYFEKIHTASGMINQGRFQALMLLPPTSADFPTTCLLHGMLSVATKMVSQDFFEGELKYWPSNMTIADYHAEQCEKLVAETFPKRGKGLQAVQAAILVCFHCKSTFGRAGNSIDRGKGLTHLLLLLLLLLQTTLRPSSWKCSC